MTTINWFVLVQYVSGLVFQLSVSVVCIVWIKKELKKK